MQKHLATEEDSYDPETTNKMLPSSVVVFCTTQHNDLIQWKQLLCCALFSV